LTGALHPGSIIQAADCSNGILQIGRPTQVLSSVFEGRTLSMNTRELAAYDLHDGEREPVARVGFRMIKLAVLVDGTEEYGKLRCGHRGL
jgi:hypothetical protein